MQLSQRSKVGDNEETKVNDNNNNTSGNEKSDTSTNSLRNRVIQTIIDLVCIIIVFGAFIIISSAFEPFKRGFFCDDKSIYYPYKDNTVASWVVAVYGTFTPIIVIILVELYNSKLYFCQKTKCEKSRSIFTICTLHALSMFVLGAGITLLLTELGKRWVGRLRPHFMDVCKPDLSKINCTTIIGTNLFYNYVETSGSFCTGDAKLIKEARVSFPSGHSSYSCYTMLFLIIYLEARFHSLRFRFVKPMIQLLAFIAAYLTVTSRVNDHHHHPTDVIAGSLLGTAVGLFSTFVIGRVLWHYHPITPLYDFDIKIL